VIASSHDGIRLERFHRRWGEAILGWIASPQELRDWAARADFPLTDATVFHAWHADADVAPYVLLTEDIPVAYGEIWLDESDGSAELGRLVVSPRHRGRGLGRMLVERLASRADDAGYQQVWVRVIPTNAAALRCYESAGFTRVATEEAAMLNATQRLQFTWMVRLETEAPRV
jgi:ribosomal protein S18 acetylase RimI-like enzyme